jgi:flavin-dependent dehydrogenase
MTGEGIAVALRGAELASHAAVGALEDDRRSADALRPYERERDAAFRDTWKVSRLFQWIIQRPVIGPFAVRRLTGRPPAAMQVLGVVTGQRPAADILSARFLGNLLAPGH